MNASNFYFLVFIFFSKVAAAQVDSYFELPIYFVDGVGNRDTVIAGYSDTISMQACEGPFINPEFGEVNEANIPWDEVFEVRASEAFLCLLDFFQIQSHKAITKVEGDCDIFPGGQARRIFLIAKVKHMPLTISWDTTLLNEGEGHCRNGSLLDRTPFSSLYPDIEFPEGAVARMNKTDHLVDSFPTNLDILEEGQFGTWTNIRNQGGNLDTFRIYEVKFGNDFWLPPVATIDLNEIPLTLYPNPAYEEIRIDEMKDIQFVSAGVYNIAGQEILFSELNPNVGLNIIPVSNLTPGFYSIVVKTSKGELMKGKFIKQ
ncbi:MAG: T9SS type A sorting domain-containing protein [Saprospiraceae bacterium]